MTVHNIEDFYTIQRLQKELSEIKDVLVGAGCFDPTESYADCVRDVVYQNEIRRGVILRLKDELENAKKEIVRLKAQKSTEITVARGYPLLRGPISLGLGVGRSVSDDNSRK